MSCIAIYHSNECSHIFSTVKDAAINFPSSAFRFCDTCGKTHFFTRITLCLASTPKQIKACEELGGKMGVVEFDVVI